MQNDIFDEVYEKALSLLGRRPHSRMELFRKLRKRKYSSSVINRVLEQCEKYSFLNDEDFAAMYLEELQGRGYGWRRIKNEFYKKGLSQDIIQKTLEKIDEASEKERAQKMLGKKMKLLKKEKDPRKKREKCCRHLASKGFSSDIVFSILNNIDFD